MLQPFWPKTKQILIGAGLIGSLALQGCIGTFVMGREDTDEPYPTLHSVPERPPAKNPAPYNKAIQEHQKSSAEDLEKNKQLREEYNLPLETSRKTTNFGRTSKQK